ncbi:transglutaminase domain-containing protein [Halorhabdus sp. BNX81]|uniref:transglutaminase TgpA family protein n=1 Tax=Halorhabdus sp. BNX81 TaxID=2980181 RepID=UPI0023DD58B2|nr:transglutaminase domain-containing protein [Halorhabdus sp. BNX81]WEL22068.1 Transglutaminase-like cysteine protease [Halorhabdus sp. BNX81]
MSVTGREQNPGRDGQTGITGRVRDITPVRLLALGGALLVIGSFVGVVHDVVDVISDPGLLQLVVAVTFVGSTIAARYLTVRKAVVLAVVLLAGSLQWYLLGLSGATLWPWPHIQYTIALLAGNSVLGIVNLEAWVIAVTPAPIFLAWYLAVRRHYAPSAAIGGTTLLFFVLTGDAGADLTLLGVVGVVTLVGAGELDRLGASIGETDIVATVVAIAIVASVTISIVPAGAAFSFSPDSGLSDSAAVSSSAAPSDGTLEGSLLSASEELSIQGSLELTSELRYAVTSNKGSYWRVAAYDLYTGDGWVRRGGTGSTDQRLGSPPDRSRTVEQTYRAITEIGTMPAVWRPSEISGPAAENARATRLGGLQPIQPLAANDSYRVTSEVPIATASELRDAGEAYPASVKNQYLQLPDSTPDRVAERTEQLTGNADNPYDTARVIEQWLESNREYSLNVSKPSGTTADSFLFEMDQGYCTYYATTMATMLRTQDIPARFVVGYTSGQRVGEDEWLVRGHNSHAWVEVYFPDVGWIRFDPTPAGPRDSTTQQDLESARAANESNVDTNRSQGGEWTPTPTETETEAPETDDQQTVLEEREPSVPEYYGPDAELNGSEFPGGQFNATATDRTDTANESEGRRDNEGGLVPGLEQLTLAALAMFGFAGVARRSGLTDRAYRAVWLRWQPREEPATDVERAFDRLVYLLERRHRKRHPGETVRHYLDAVDADERARRVATIRERARYADTVDRDAADEAVELVDELVGDT